MVLEQHGGRKIISTEGAAFILTDVFMYINHNNKKKMHAGWIFWDLAKGFYSHEILLAKLRFFVKFK